MSDFRWRRKADDLEAQLRAARPTPRDDFVRGLRREIVGEPPARRRSFAVAVVFTAAILVALSAVGGLGYAASSASHAVHAVKNVVVKSHTPAARLRPARVTPAQTEYRPGCGLGDKNHIHTGPPGQGGVCPANKP